MGAPKLCQFQQISIRISTFTIPRKIFLDQFPISRLLKAPANHLRVTLIVNNLSNNLVVNELGVRATTMAGVRVTEQTPIRSRDHHKTAVKAKASREAVGDSIKALDEVAAIRANDKTLRGTAWWPWPTYAGAVV